MKKMHVQVADFDQISAANPCYYEILAIEIRNCLGIFRQLADGMVTSVSPTEIFFTVYGILILCFLRPFWLENFLHAGHLSCRID
jgi:hypothetical protein